MTRSVLGRLLTPARPTGERTPYVLAFGSERTAPQWRGSPRSIDFMPALHPTFARLSRRRGGRGLRVGPGRDLGRVAGARRHCKARCSGIYWSGGDEREPLALQSINSRRAPTRTSWPLRRGSLLRTVAMEASMRRRCASVAERQWWQRRRERLLGHAKRSTHAIVEVRALLAGADVVS